MVITLDMVIVGSWIDGLGENFSKARESYNRQIYISAPLIMEH
jgi:hypothetical protein